MQETWVWSLGQEDPLKKEMATHSSILAWEISQSEEPGRLQYMGSQKFLVIKHNLVTKQQHNDAICWNKHLMNEPPWILQYPADLSQLILNRTKKNCYISTVFVLFVFQFIWIYHNLFIHSVSNGYFSSAAQSCLILCDRMKYSTPGFPVHHQLLKLAQTHVHQIGDAVQPSHPLSSPSPPVVNLSQHQGIFQWVSSSHQVTKVSELQLRHQSFWWISRTDLL